MLRHGVGCLVEVLFERVPPLRAFGPPVGMTMVGVYKLLGDMATQSVAMGRRTPPCIARTCPRERGHATRSRWVKAPPGAVGSRHPWICHPAHHPRRGGTGFSIHGPSDPRPAHRPAGRKDSVGPASHGQPEGPL